jgi:uncharacterized membrane protein SpoIIM required for sporulation
MKKEKTGVEIAMSFVLGLVATGFHAFTVTMLWSWFAVAVFGLPALSIVAVFGFEILVNTFRYNPYTTTVQEKEGVQASIEIIGVSALALLAGFLLHLMM